MKRLAASAGIILKCLTATAQDSTAALHISGYTEIYYLYDFNKPAVNSMPGFLYSHNRHNEFNLNLGFIKFQYTAQRVRANAAIGTGTYMNANYANEQGVLKNVFEANAGIKISSKKNLWVDAGILPSHIGFESAVSKDCQTLTRSILADNSPYYESGARISYTPANGKWLFSIMALNGWQRIKRVEGNSLLSWGTQVQYKSPSGFLINYSTFAGSDKPDTARLLRYFHNLYGIFNADKKTTVTAGFDIGAEQRNPGSKTKNYWFSPVLILQHKFNEKWAAAGRVEYYHDRHGVIVTSGNPEGFQTSGYSFNIDHSPFHNILIRAEARAFHSKFRLFTQKNRMVNSESFVTASLAVSF